MIPGIWYIDKFGGLWKRLSYRNNFCINENNAGLYIHQDRVKDWKLTPIQNISDLDVSSGQLSKFGF